LFGPRGETWVSPEISLLGSALPLAIAYCLAGYVYWWWVFRRGKKVDELKQGIDATGSHL
jgi:hypothetical protein